MLKSERVLLRPMKREDIPRQHDFNQDVDIYALDCEQPVVSPLQVAEAFFDGRTKPNPNLAPFAIEVDGKYIGHCQLSGLQDKHGNAELGVGIGDREYWGRGYGRETVRLLLEFAFGRLGIRRIHLTTHARNERALRCYRACGFVEEGRPRQVLWIEGDYVDLVNMSVLREEWCRIRDDPGHQLALFRSER